MDLQPIDRAEMAFLLEEITSLTPINNSDFSLGYHTSLMYIKKFIMGKDPFEITFDWDTMRIKGQNPIHD